MNWRDQCEAFTDKQLTTILSLPCFKVYHFLLHLGFVTAIDAWLLHKAFLNQCYYN